MAQDSRPAPDVLTTPSYQNRGSKPLAAARYTSEDFARLERERMWPRVWQFAAREEDLPEAGDYVVYENAGRSFLISRQDDGSVRAMHNVCLHRGRKLRTEDGHADRFVCPFHGFAWNKDGSFNHMPCKWDFAHLEEANLSLPPVEVGNGAAIFSCARSRAGRALRNSSPPARTFQALAARGMHHRHVGGQGSARQLESDRRSLYGGMAPIVTHPQLLPFTGDCNSAYWTWGDHVNVNLVPFGIMSPHLDPSAHNQQWIVDEFVKYNGRSGDNYDAGGDPYYVTVPEGVSARQALGAKMRAAYTAQTGYDHSDATDAELLDALVYNVFPNFAPWGGFMPNIVYRWRPGKTPDTCIMEVRILMRVKKGEKHPRGVPMKFLRLDQKWTEAPELGILGDVFEQDMDNLPYVQEGLHASKTASSIWAIIRKSACASFSRRWTNIWAFPKAAMEQAHERDASKARQLRADLWRGVA
jgi:nitrite reductase/ring-hydroxylating ferredoxin subunit